MSRGSKAAARGRDTAILLVSQEPFLLSEAERDLRDRLIPPGERDLNYLALYAWETDIGQVLEFLQTLPFLGNGRLLVLREVQKFQDLETLKGYLADPNPTSCLLMTSSQLKKTDALFRALSALSETSELKKPAGRALAGWVAQRFARSGKRIDGELAEILVQVAGGDMGILSTEIEKVVLCSGEREVISEEDLSVSVPGGVGVVFGLLDALGDGDRTEALAALRSLMDADNPPEYLVHMMAWHYRQLLRGKELVHSGLTPFEAASRLGKRFQGLKEKFARHMGRATEGGLERALESLSRCDRQLKTGRIPERTLLDRLVLDLLV